MVYAFWVKVVAAIHVAGPRNARQKKRDRYVTLRRNRSEQGRNNGRATDANPDHPDRTTMCQTVNIRMHACERNRLAPIPIDGMKPAASRRGNAASRDLNERS